MAEEGDDKSESGGFRPLGSEELLLMASDALKKNIEHALRQLKARKVRGEMKLRWSRALVRDAEALVKVAEALSKMGAKSAADMDISSYLSSVQTRVPEPYATPRLARIVARTRSRWAAHVDRRAR